MKSIFVNKKSGKVTKMYLVKFIIRKIAYIVSIFATSCVVTFSRLVAHFCCVHNSKCSCVDILIVKIFYLYY